MKKLLLITLSLFTYFSYGQTEQGKIIAGATSTFGFNSSKVKDAQDSVIIFDFSPQVGYFLIDNLSFGIASDIETIWDGNITEKSLGIGPFARFYFLEGDIKPFLQTEYLFGSVKVDFEDDNFDQELSKTKTNVFGITGGVSFFLNDFVAIDAQVSYVRGNVDSESILITEEVDIESSFSGYGFNIGFSLFF